MKTREDLIIEVVQASKLPGAVLEFKERYCFQVTWERVTAPNCAWNFWGNDYRVLAPNKGGTRHITAKDWDGQAAVWVRGKDRIASMYIAWMVIAIDDIEFALANSNMGLYRVAFADVHKKHHNWQYSFDRKTWHPFVVNEPGEMRVVASTDPEDECNKEES